MEARLNLSERKLSLEVHAPFPFSYISLYIHYQNMHSEFIVRPHVLTSQKS
jgi:hypothetical protein